MASVAQARFDAIPIARTKFNIQTAVIVMLLSLVFLIRITDLNYNTLFVDEAIYTTIGKELIVGEDLQASTAWMFGSSLYPIMAAVADRAGGLVLMRGLSAALSTLAALSIFLVTQQLFKRRAAMWSLFIFGFAGVSISIGQLATYDVLGMSLLAVSFLGIVSAANAKRLWTTVLCLYGGGLALSLSILGKYIGIAYLPTLLLIGAILLRLRGKPIIPCLALFLQTVVLVMGIYIFVFWHDLLEVFSGQHSSQFIARRFIVQIIGDEIGFVVFAAIGGALYVARSYVSSRPFSRKWLMTIGIAAMLMLAALALPTYHIVTGNVRALEKHCVYSLIFLTPLAAAGVTTLIKAIRERRGPFQRVSHGLGLLLTVVIVIWVTNYGLDRNWGFQHNWPNQTAVIDYLMQQGLSENSYVMASGSATYEYYFGFDIYTSRRVWFSTWYLKYRRPDGTEIQGEEAMREAITSRSLDFVILDDYYTPEMNAVLQPILNAAGYTLGFEDVSILANGVPISTRVYVPPAGAA